MPGWIAAVDWQGMLRWDVAPLEIVLRGTLVYLGSFVLLRIIVKREFSGLGIPDLIVIVFIADAAQNAMAGSYRSVPAGLLLVATLMFWAYTLDRLAFRFPWFEKLVKPKPVPVIRDGQMLRRNMHHEFITEAELRAALRQQGIEDVAEVKSACVESDGRISVISLYSEQHTAPETGRPG